jgi:hypothetical protein
MNLSPSYFNIAISFIKNLLANNHMINVQTESDKFDIFFTNVKTVEKSPFQSHLLNKIKNAGFAGLSSYCHVTLVMKYK